MPTEKEPEIVKCRYKIPEKNIIRECFKKIEAEINVSKSASPFFNPIACKLFAGSDEFYDLCDKKNINPASIRGVPVYIRRGIPLNTQINDSIGPDISDIVSFVNDFISYPYELYRVNLIPVINLTREQYAKINGKRWKNWSWSSVFFGRFGIKYIHRTGLGPFNDKTTEEEVQEELKNARRKAKNVLRKKIFGPSLESIRADEEGRKLIDYATHIDNVVGNYVHYGNLRPRDRTQRGRE